MKGVTKVKDLIKGLEGLKQDAPVVVLIEGGQSLNAPGEIIDIQQQRAKLIRNEDEKHGILFDIAGESTVLITVTFDV